MAVAAATAGCASDERGASKSGVSSRPATVNTASPAPARPLVFLQRNGGLAATLDTVTVRADGTVRLERRYGGAGGRFTDFRLRPADLKRLRTALRRARVGRPARRSGHPTPKGSTFILRTPGGTTTALEGAIPGRLRPLVKLLEGVLDGEVPRRSLAEIAVSRH